MRFKAGAPQRCFRLTLEQQNATVTGEFAELPAPNSGALAGTVTGTAAADRLELGGNLRWVSLDFPDLFQLTDLQDFDATLEEGGQRMAGTFVFADRARDGSVFMRRGCKILRLEREAE